MLKLPHKILREFQRGTIHKGLIPKYEGAFEMVKRMAKKITYRLKLPKRLKVQPTFHVSLIKPLSWGYG